MGFTTDIIGDRRIGTIPTIGKPGSVLYGSFSASRSIGRAGTPTTVWPSATS